MSTKTTTPSILEAEPAVLTGALIGYARVSTRDQNLDRQTDALAEAGCLRVFADKKSGKSASRPELEKALDFMRPGDTLVVASLDRLSRSLQDLISMVAELRERGVGFQSLHEQLDTTTPGGRLIFHVFAALAEFIRELIVEGTREGLDAARARGRVGGRPPVMTTYTSSVLCEHHIFRNPDWGQHHQLFIPKYGTVPVARFQRVPRSWGIGVRPMGLPRLGSQPADVLLNEL